MIPPEFNIFEITLRIKEKTPFLTVML